MAVSTRNAEMRTYHGIASADKANDSRELYVYSEELLPFLRGELKAVQNENKIETTGNQGAFKGQTNTTNSIRAIYRDDSSSGAAPPMVRKGEQVLLYNYGDSSTWYWKSEGRNDGARRTDVWRKAISGTLENNADLDDDNAYFIELNTRTKHHIKLSTSNQNGEKHRYMLLLDADASQVFLGDEAGNCIGIESETPRVFMKNKDNSFLDLNMKNIIMAAEQDISIMSKSGNVLLAGQQDVKIVSGANMVQECGGAWSMSYKEGGTCSGPGANLVFSVGHMSVKKA